MKPTIIAAAHGAEGRDAVALGVTLATLYDARLVVAGIVVVPAGPYSRSYEQAARKEVQHDLTRACDHVPPELEHAELIRPSSSVVHGLHDLATSEHAMMIVLGPSQLGWLGRMAHGDVGAGLLHDAPCAIAVAPAGYVATSRTRPVAGGVIGVAWDGSAEAGLAATAAAALAERAGARVRLIHVVEPLPSSTELSWAADEEVMGNRRTAAAVLVEEEAARLHGRCPVETHVVEGAPAFELAEASTGVDLLVAGSRSYGPFRRMILGSVGARLLHGASCPVLVVPRGSGEPDGRGAMRETAAHARG